MANEGRAHSLAFHSFILSSFAFRESEEEWGRAVDSQSETGGRRREEGRKEESDPMAVVPD